jgi:hypothetical protein
MRLTRGIDHVIALYPSSLISKIQSGESKGVFAHSAFMGGTKSGKGGFGMWRIS